MKSSFGAALLAGPVSSTALAEAPTLQAAIGDPG